MSANFVFKTRHYSNIYSGEKIFNNLILNNFKGNAEILLLSTGLSLKSFGGTSA